MVRDADSDIKHHELALAGTRPARPGYVRQSGGLRWHLRAFAGRNRHAVFRNCVADWLNTWRPPTTGLILVGPSGGWCLPTEFLARWARVLVIDLDPLSPLLLRLRHGLRAETRCADFVEELPRALADCPTHAVLFANLLGQLSLERDDHEHVRARLQHLLARRHWASFHDRYSADVEPALAIAARPMPDAAPMTPTVLQRLAMAREWVDHGTERVLPLGVSRDYFPWRIVGRRFHWVEAGIVEPEDGLDLLHDA